MSRMPPASSRWKQRGGIVASLIAVLLFILLCSAAYLVRGPILRFVGESWMVEDQLERSDAIIVLSDDNFYADRATRAAELFRRCVARGVGAGEGPLRAVGGVAARTTHHV